VVRSLGSFAWNEADKDLAIPLQLEYGVRPHQLLLDHVVELVEGRGANDRSRNPLSHSLQNRRTVVRIAVFGISSTRSITRFKLFPVLHSSMVWCLHGVLLLVII
jgi:hypothetical protein